MTPLVAQNLDDKGEITEANKSIQRGLTSEEKKPVNEDRPEKTLAGWHQEDQDPMGKMVRNYQGGETTEHQGRHITVHRYL